MQVWRPSCNPGAAEEETGESLQLTCLVSLRLLRELIAKKSPRGTAPEEQQERLWPGLYGHAHTCTHTCASAHTQAYIHAHQYTYMHKHKDEI